MTTRTHPLFQRYPLTGQASLSTEPAPTPYHIYDGYGALSAARPIWPLCAPSGCPRVLSRSRRRAARSSKIIPA
jgi:hypothetical protein